MLMLMAPASVPRLEKRHGVSFQVSYWSATHIMVAEEDVNRRVEVWNQIKASVGR
jgi:hypothetical protein